MPHRYDDWDRLLRIMPRAPSDGGGGRQRSLDDVYLNALPSADDPAINAVQGAILSTEEATRILDEYKLKPVPESMRGGAPEDYARRVAYYEAQYRAHLKATARRAGIVWPKSGEVYRRGDRVHKVRTIGRSARRPVGTCVACGERARKAGRGLCEACYWRYYYHAGRTGHCLECGEPLRDGEAVCDRCFPTRYRRRSETADGRR